MWLKHESLGAGLEGISDEGLVGMPVCLFGFRGVGLWCEELDGFK